MKKFLLKFRNSKWSKVFACCLIFTVFISMFAISSSAAEASYATSSFVYKFSNGSHTDISSFDSNMLEFYLYGEAKITSIYWGDYSWGGFQDQSNSFMRMLFITDYTSIFINGVEYGCDEEPWSGGPTVPFSDTYEISSTESYRSPGSVYYLTLVFHTREVSDYNSGYIDGFNAGMNSDSAKDKWYNQGYNAGIYSEGAKDYWSQKGYEEGYSAGLNDGLNSNVSRYFGQNLIGDTLSAPLRALNSFVLYTAPNGTVVTLGFVFGGLISLVLLMAFLRIFGV